jgi:monomeric sarcosine oxidase
LAQNKTYDVAVIGAGVFGAWTACRIQRDGRQVILIDSYGAANSRASSGDESRIIRMGYGPDEIYTRSALRALQLWKAFSAENKTRIFHETGVLWLAHENDPYPVKTRETLARFGVPFETLTSDETARRYPQLGLENISWAMLEPESGVLSARRAVQAVVHAAIQAGAEFLQAAVTTPASQKQFNYIVTETGERISAAAYVFACGPWLPKLFPELLGDRIVPTRQEVFYFGAPPGGSQFTSRVLPAWIDFKDEVYGLPDIDGRGVKVAIDRHGPTFDPDSGDRVVTREGLAEARSCLKRRLPALADAPVIESRVCQYENTSNGDFLIDRHPDFENVWLVGGGSGHGFKHGPVVGEYVVARIDGSNEEIEPRFSLERKKREQRRAVY